MPHSSGLNYELDLPGNGTADVSIQVSTEPLLKAHARWIINDFFNNIPEHRTMWHGIDADLGVIACTTPAGPCPGFQGGFTVLVGRTLYDVFVFSTDRQTAERVVDSVRIT